MVADRRFAGVGERESLAMDTHQAEASRGAVQAAQTSCNGNPLVGVRTGARHEDGC